MVYIKNGYILLSDLISVLEKIRWEGDDDEAVSLALMKAFIVQMLCEAPVYEDNEIILGSCSGIDIRVLRSGQLKPEEWENVSEIANKLDAMRNNVDVSKGGG